MATQAPFTPHGLTVGLTTSATPNTAISRQITPATLGIAQHLFGDSSSVMCINRGAADIWVSFTTAAAVIAIPVANSTDTGTPEAGLILVPGAYLVFTIPTGPTLWVNDISTGASNSYYLTFGEGS